MDNSTDKTLIYGFTKIAQIVLSPKSVIKEHTELSILEFWTVQKGRLKEPKRALKT